MKKNRIQAFSYTIALAGLLALPVLSYGAKGEEREEASRVERAEDFDRADKFDREEADRADKVKGEDQAEKDKELSDKVLERFDREDKARAEAAIREEKEREPGKVDEADVRDEKLLGNEKLLERVKDPEKVDDEIEKATEKSLKEPGRADVFDRAEVFHELSGDARNTEQELDFEKPAREQVEARVDLLDEHAKKLAEEAEKEDKVVELKERKGDIIIPDEDFPISKDAKDTLDLIGRAKGALEVEGEEKGEKEAEKAAEKFDELPASEQKKVIESEEIKHVQDPSPEERDKFLKDKGRIGRFEDGDRFIGDDGQERGAKAFEAHPREEIDRDIAEAAKRAR